MNILGRIKLYYDRYKYREIRHIRNPKEPIYYIIRRKSPGAGFFSNYFYVLSHLNYANKRGWISVVDMQNYPTLYTEEKELFGTKNGWEYYFKQPGRITVEKGYASGNYVISRNAYLAEEGVPVYSINQGHITSAMVKNLYPLQQKFIPVVDEIQAEVDTQFEQLIDGSKCVGVHIRGTDMKETRDAHTLPPGVTRSQEALDAILEQEKDIKIFLCCDEAEIVDIFKGKYGNRVISLTAYRSESNSTQGIHMQTSNRPNHRYLLGREVLMDCLMLSKCTYLICGISNVTSAAILYNNMKYEKVVLLK